MACIQTKTGAFPAGELTLPGAVCYKPRTRMPRQATDAINAWFMAAEELGEYIGIRFGRIAPGGHQPEWTFLRHTDFDGIGGLADMLRKRGAKLERLQQLKYPGEPSWGPLIRSLPKLLLPRRRVQWGELSRGEVATSSPTEPPRAVAWHVFNESSTKAIRRACRMAGVTVNSFLVKHLSKAIRPSLADQASTIPWMVPVNLRGKIFLDRDTTNYSSYVCVNVASYETVQDVHQKIYAALARGDHWANWYSYKSGNLLSSGLKKTLIKKELATAQWNIGGFSNLGDWDPQKTITQPDCLGTWLFSPPVLRCQVIGAGCVTFQGQLSLTLQTHPDLTTDSSVPEGWVKQWVEEIELDLASRSGMEPQ